MIIYLKLIIASKKQKNLARFARSSLKQAEGQAGKGGVCVGIQAKRYRWEIERATIKRESTIISLFHSELERRTFLTDFHQNFSRSRWFPAKKKQTAEGDIAENFLARSAR